MHGRAGRENLPGEVVIQTYNPDNFAIEYAKKQDYDLFYNAEIMLRNRLKYPPFCDIIVMCISSSDEANGRKMSKNWYEFLTHVKQDSFFVYPPMPAPISKIKNKYRFRMIIKCNFNNHMINLLNEGLEKQETWKIKATRVSIDVNPSSMM